MKKLIPPSILLAGLLICLPTISAKADYQPYSYGTIHTQNETKTHANGFTTNLYFATTPGPSALLTSSVVNTSAPSGITDQDSFFGHKWDNYAIWSWTGGGTPANFTETRDIQQAPITSSYTGSGSATGHATYYGYMNTGRSGSASIGSPENTLFLYNSSANPSWTPQAVASSSKTGSAYLWAMYASDLNWYVGLSNGGSNTKTGMGQAGVTYTTP